MSTHSSSSSSLLFLLLSRIRTSTKVGTTSRTLPCASATAAATAAITVCQSRQHQQASTKLAQQTLIGLNRTHLSHFAAFCQPPCVSLSSSLLLCDRSEGSSLQQALRRSFSSFHKYKSIMDAPPGVFRGSVDRFNGITVESELEFEAAVDFAAKLQKSLDHWQANKRRAIWFIVQTKHSAWIPHLTQNGFEFHHAKTGLVVLYRWLPTEESANIPVYSHTMLGVGGLVVNDQNEVLVVSERFSLIPESWKLPGGYVEPAEDLVDATIREVREETGIDCEFRTVVSIRHTHGGAYGCSDMYVVIGLKPRNLNWQRCEREIAKVQWMPVAEYLQHPKVHETNRHFVRTYLEYERRGIRFTCEKGRHQILKKEYCLYFMQPIGTDAQQTGEIKSTTSNKDRTNETPE